jgi:type I restriction enzyme S subunit
MQDKIVGILSAYDDLIGNNQRRIQILGDMARALYGEWFVHFRFPGHEKVKRVASSLGPIPSGWKVVALQDVTTKIGSGATPRGGKEAYKAAGTSLIRSLNIYDYQFEFSNLAFIDDEQAAQLDNVVVEPRDVLLNITGASVARCSMVPSYILPARVNQHVAIVRANPRSMNPYYLLDTINNDENKKKLLGLAQGGATREALTKDTISNFVIVLPPREFLIRYGQVAEPLHTQRETLNRQTRQLRCMRDLLLPRLLSGQVNLEAN